MVWEQIVKGRNMNVNWIKSKAGTWLDFENFTLPVDVGIGVYIIWYKGNPGRVVYIGQGNIADRLRAHRNRSDILRFQKNGRLLVTWAELPSKYLDGVERYLANQYRPLVGDAYPDVVPVLVNSPWK